MLKLHGHAGSVAEGGDCIIVTSQPFRTSDGLFEGAVSVRVKTPIATFSNNEINNLLAINLHTETCKLL